MKPFLSGVILALLIAVPTAAILLRRVKRQASRREALQTDPDETLTRLTGELAHEIKNPLSTIKVNLKLTKEALEDIDLREPNKPALDRCQQGLSSAMRKITIIQKETDRLEQIVDGFLRYVKRPDLHLVTMDLNELVGDMVDFYLPQAYSHSLTLRHSLAAAPLICRVDAGALKQVLLNLLINAQQAMDRGGELMIRTRSRSGKAVIQIDDTGRGIPAEKLPTLFQPYCSFRTGGTGLGLATAKKIVESHGGTISVHSEVGKGTSFTIELPLAGAVGASDEVTA
ncbi:MAG TPA: ATP-binding protein [Sedimentisphaerales bacterium]|nr:ATP-binding protein [Sedimentisphaerales bacterium]HRS12041.1 ATP-binding protein [Sedimentisphaerales bacterium]HRV48526.1 ATP-binding protein [Sedimentisphaerales bacterium]